MMVEIDVFMGGKDDGFCPGVQQFDACSRVYVCRLWSKKGVPYEMDENAIVGVVYDWPGGMPSNEYKADIIDKSTIRIVVPSAATQRAGSVKMQIKIHQLGGLLNGPVVEFQTLKSLQSGDRETDEPVQLVDGLFKTAEELLKAANETAERVNQMQIDAEGLAGDSNKLGGKPPEYYLPKDGKAANAENAEKLGGKPPEYYLPADGVAANAEKLGGKAPEYYLPAANLLDNSYFRNLIAQAGFMARHGSDMYLADRWLVSGSSSISYDETNKIIAFAESTSPTIIRQKVSRDHNISGKPVTLALKASYVSGTVHLSESGAEAGHQDFTIFEGINCYTVTGGSDMSVIVWSKSGGSVEIEWIALYEGEYTAETLPQYVPKGYAAELMECRRYFQTSDANFEASSLWSANFNTVQLIPQMRTNPTVTAKNPYTGEHDVYTYWDDATASYKNIGGVNVSATTTYVRFLNTGEFVAGTTYTTRYEASADL